MKFASVLLLLLSTVASGSIVSLPVYSPGIIASQYHAQDELGQASFGYSYPGQARSSFQDRFGNQIGSWAYYDAEGKEIKISYVADSEGFRVLSNDLPVAPTADLIQSVAPVRLDAPEPVQETSEVAEARAAHMEAHAEAAKALAAALSSANSDNDARDNPVKEEQELTPADTQDAVDESAHDTFASSVDLSTSY